MQCFLWFLIPAGIVFVFMTIQRWFEQTEEAVEQRLWSKLIILVLMPFSVWLFPHRVGAGRLVPVPRHEPVRGFGVASKPAGPPVPIDPAPTNPADEVPLASVAPGVGSDQPPPGTPPEFLGMPVIPPKSRKPSAGPDLEKLAKLRQKMREQGMIPDDE
jgi:hypothetical protein